MVQEQNTKHNYKDAGFALVVEAAGRDGFESIKSVVPRPTSLALTA